MKNTLVVIADLACLKAYRIDDSHPHSSPRLELVEEFHSPEAHGKLVDKVSDLAGQFRRAASGGPSSNDERHNIALESRKRFVRQLADRVDRLARNTEIEKCLVAVSREINKQLIEELSPQVRAKISKNVPADLTKIEKSELLTHF